METGHTEPLPSFRGLPTTDIIKYRCVHDNCRSTFLELYGSNINSVIYVQDELSVEISARLPVGILYDRDSSLYAMGVVNHTGIVDFACHEPKPERVLWDEYVENDFNCGEITDLLIWRCRLLLEPVELTSDLVNKFEDSRWLMFIFWEDKIEKLIDLELELMQFILRYDVETDTSMLEKKIRGQYANSTFTMSPDDMDFNEQESCFGKQINTMLKSIL